DRQGHSGAVEVEVDQAALQEKRLFQGRIAGDGCHFPALPDQRRLAPRCRAAGAICAFTLNPSLNAMERTARWEDLCASCIPPDCISAKLRELRLDRWH